MGLLEQWVFAYQHNVFDDDNFDKIVGNNHFGIIDDSCFEYTIAHYLQIFVAQVLGKLVGIMVVDVAPAMVIKSFTVAQYWLFD